MNAADKTMARSAEPAGAPPRAAAQLLSGNHACALGAIAAGCRFFPG